MGLKEVLELIVNITQNASKCEENKQKLNDHFTFEPYALFSRIDRDDKKYITTDKDISMVLQDIVKYIEYYNVLYTKEPLHLNKWSISLVDIK